MYWLDSFGFTSALESQWIRVGMGRKKLLYGFSAHLDAGKNAVREKDSVFIRVS